MHKTLHPRDDVDSFYVSVKKGGNGFACIQDSDNLSTQRLDDYIHKCGGRLITTTRNNAHNACIRTISKKEQIRENKIADVDYVMIGTKM